MLNFKEGIGFESSFVISPTFGLGGEVLEQAFIKTLSLKTSHGPKIWKYDAGLSDEGRENSHLFVMVLFFTYNTHIIVLI